MPSVTIVDLLNRHALDKVDILKMDIEGAEGFVFESAEEWLDRVGWIMLEVHFDAMPLSELLAIVGRCGRRVFGKPGGLPGKRTKQDFENTIREKSLLGKAREVAIGRLNLPIFDEASEFVRFRRCLHRRHPLSTLPLGIRAR